MIISILSSRQPVKERIKKLAYYISLKIAAKQTWNKKHNTLFSKFPEYKRPLPSSVQIAHRQMWSPFQRNFNNSTLKICQSLSGIADPAIVPEEIFRADIEPTLNNIPVSNFQSHKSFYNRWLKEGLFPPDLMYVINGEILDREYNPLDLKKAEVLCRSFTYPVVVKPNMDSYGGKGVQLIDDPALLSAIIRRKKNIVIQKKIFQHPELAKFNKKSLNTVRVYLYKSVKNNQFHILGIMPRMGNGGHLDNISTGGLATIVDEKGKLPGYALGHELNKYQRHPFSDEPFTGVLPDFNGLRKISLMAASKLFLLRIVGLDLCYDITGQWRVIEINTIGHTIRSIQYFGRPFFGEFTNEVIDYCINNHWAKNSRHK